MGSKPSDVRPCHSIDDRKCRLSAVVFAVGIALVGVAFVLFIPEPAEAVTIDSSNASSPAPGIRVVEGRTSGPATDFHAAFVDLCADYVHVGASDYGGLRSAGAWGSSVGAQLAVNGDFFTLTGTDHVYGDAVGTSGRWPSARTGRDASYSDGWYYQRYGWIAFGSGWADSTNSEWVKQNNDQFGAVEGFAPGRVTKSLRSGTEALVSGFPQLVVEGEPIRCSSPTASSCFPDRSDMRDRHPRTAMGLSRDRQTFMLVVVDGRSQRSSGMYGTELADLVHKLGAWTALNLDGGGSSQMWVDGRGTINRPSDGSPRGVMNHWGVFAGDSGGRSRAPGSCDPSYEALLHQPAGQVRPPATDVDGDGLADVCARGPDGFRCHMSSGDSFSGPSGVLALSDEDGWDERDNYATLRMGDVDGDGRADVCARANASLICWRFDGSGFEEFGRVEEWSNSNGYDDLRYFTSLRLGDVDGDGRDDACIRGEEGVECRLSTADGFGETFGGPGVSDDSGWGRPEHYGTMRLADVDGDGAADLCLRANAGIRCWLAGDGEFDTRIVGPEWSDSNGWRRHRYWSTIRLADIDGDGKADLCGRHEEGIDCHLSTGDGFGPALEGPALHDDDGWADPSNYMPIRLVDVTGDGNLDICSRANAGIRCWPFEGSEFGSAFAGPLADESGWYRRRYYRTIDFADVDGDGRSDLCARASGGIVCWRSQGTGFSDQIWRGPEWSDDSGYDAPAYYSTVRLVGPRRPPPDPPDPGEGDAGAEVDVGGGADTGAAMPDAGTPPPDSDGGEDTTAGTGDPPPDDQDTIDVGDGGCACGQAPPGGAPVEVLLVLVGLLGWRWRFRRTS